MCYGAGGGIVAKMDRRGMIEEIFAVPINIPCLGILFDAGEAWPQGSTAATY